MDAEGEDNHRNRGRHRPVRFGEDETKEVKAKKSSASRISNLVSITGSTSTIEAGTRTLARGSKQKSAQRVKLTLLDLPLPRTGQHLRDWRSKKFVLHLISRAGSRGEVDPFGTNGRIVRAVWKRVY